MDPIANTHFVTMDWTRVEAVVKLPLSERSEMELQIPYDIKDMTAEYELPDGTPYDNPVGNLHHRTEKLEGFSDFKLYWNFFLEDTRFSVGVNLPVGKFEDDPFALGALGLEHEHIQFGTGTADPLARVTHLVHVAEGLDLSFSTAAQVPLVENRKGYRGPPLVDFSGGVRLSIADWLGISVSYSVLYQGRATWDGDPDPNTGYLIQGFQLSLPIRVEGLFIVPNVYRAFDVNTRDGGDTFELDWIAGLSIEVPLGGVAAADHSKPAE